MKFKLICCVWTLPCGTEIRCQGQNIQQCREVAVEVAVLEGRSPLPVDLDYFEQNEPSFKSPISVPGITGPE